MNLKLFVGSSLLIATAAFGTIFLFGLLGQEGFMLYFFLFSATLLSISAYAMRSAFTKKDIIAVILSVLLLAASTSYFASGLKSLTFSENSNILGIEETAKTNSYLSEYISYQIVQAGIYSNNTYALYDSVGQEMAQPYSGQSTEVEKLKNSLAIAQERLEEYQQAIEDYQDALKVASEPQYIYTEREHNED